MPYGALRYSQTSPIKHVSPNFIDSTPAGNSDIVVRTPGMPSPPVFGADSPSGLSKAMRNKTTLDRAHMFVKGNYDELLLSMDKPEQM